MAEAQVPVGQTDQTALLQLVEQLAADRAVGDRIGFLRIREQEGEVEDRHLLDIARQQAGVHHRHFDGAALHGRDGLQVRTQRPAGEGLDGDLAAGLGRDQLGELLDAHHLRVALVAGGRELDGAGLDVGGMAKVAGQQRGRGQQGERKTTKDVHGCLLGEWNSGKGAKNRVCADQAAITWRTPERSERIARATSGRPKNSR